MLRDVVLTEVGCRDLCMDVRSRSHLTHNDLRDMLYSARFGTQSVVDIAFRRSKVYDSTAMVNIVATFDSLTIRLPGGATRTVQLTRPQIRIEPFYPDEEGRSYHTAVHITMSRQDLIQILCAADPGILGD